MGVFYYLGTINPCRRTKSHAIPQSVDENKGNANDVGGTIRVVRVNLAQDSVDLGRRVLADVVRRRQKVKEEKRKEKGAAGLYRLTNMASPIATQPALSVTLRPRRSIRSISITVMPILSVDSIPPAISVTRVGKPSFANKVGR